MTDNERCIIGERPGAPLDHRHPVRIESPLDSATEYQVSVHAWGKTIVADEWLLARVVNEIPVPIFFDSDVRAYFRTGEHGCVRRLYAPEKMRVQEVM